MSEELGGGGGYDAGTVFIGVEADTSPLDNLPQQIAAKVANVPAITVPFNHGPLSEGNRHIESKFTHVVDVNRRLVQNPITPRYDGSQINRLTADLRAAQTQVFSLQQQRIQLEASLNATSVKTQLDVIANQSRVIYYAAVVQMPDVRQLQSSIQAELRATIDPKELRNAAPEIGKAIAKEINNSRVKVDQGGLFSGVGTLLFSGTASIFRGFQESIGREIFLGLSRQTRSGFRDIGARGEAVSSAVVSPIRNFAQSEDLQASIRNATDRASEYLRRGAYRFGDALADAIDAETNKVQAFTNRFNQGLSAEKLRADFQSVASDAKEIKNDIVAAVAKGADLSGIFEPLGRVLARYREVAIEERSIALATQRASEILASGKATQQFGTYTDPAGNVRRQFVRTANVVDENTDELIIGIGGYGKAQGRSGLRIPGLLDLPERSKAIAVLNPDTDIRRKDENDRLGKVTEMIKSLSKPNLRGFSKDAIEIVAQALVAIERNQSITIKLLGESGGGYPAEEAERILQKLGYGDRVQRLSVGTPDLAGRLMQGNKIISPDEILGRETAVLSRFGAANAPSNITGVTEHPIENYLKVAEVQNLLYGAPPPFSDAEVANIQTAAKNFESLAKQDLSRGEREKVAADALEYLEAVRRRFLVAMDDEAEQLGTLIKAFETAYSNFSEEPEAFKRMRSVIRQASELADQLQGSGLQGAQTGAIARNELSQYRDEFRKQFGATVGIGTQGAKAEQILSETQSIIGRLSDPAFFARPLPEKAPVPSAITVAETESAPNVIAKLSDKVGDLVVASKRATQSLLDLEDRMTFGLASRYRNFLGRQAQETLGLTGDLAGAVGRQVLLPGAARAIGGTVGALQGAERSVLGLAPFGLGFGAKGLIQAGAGFAALNAVAPGAAGLITGAGSGLGGALASQLGNALTGAAVESAPGLIAPVVQAIGAGITGLLAAGGGTVGAGVAALGAGATGVNLTGKIAARLNPLPELLALPERREAQDSGRLLAQSLTKQVIEGVRENARNLPAAGFNLSLPVPRVETARNLLQATSNRVTQERAGLEQGGAGLVVSELRGRLGGIRSQPILQPEDISNLKVALLLVERISATLDETRTPANRVFNEFPGQFEDQFQAMQSNKGQLGRVRSNALEAIAQFAPSIRAAAKAGDDTAAGYIESVKKALPEIESAASATAKRFIVTIKKELGIASPSRVMIGIAQDLMAGLPIGVRSRLADVAAAAVVAKDTFLKNFTPVDPVIRVRPRTVEPSPFAESDFVVPRRQLQQRVSFEPLALPSAEMRAARNNPDLSQFVTRVPRGQTQTTPLPINPQAEQSLNERAFATGRAYGERFGAGLKDAGKFVENEARNIGDRIPQSIKDGAAAGGQGIKGFITGLREQFAIARQEIPTIDLLAKGIGNVALLVGGGFVGVTIFQQIQQQAVVAFESVKRLQALRVSLDISTRGQGAEVLDDIAKQADAAGGNLAQFRQNYTQFAAALRNTPIERQTNRLSSAVDTLGVGLQLPAESVQRVRTQITQIASKPNVQREDLITLSESLPGAFNLSARAIGVTNAEFGKLLETGQLASTDFIPKLVNVINREFSGALVTASGSLQSAENRLASANLQFQELGQKAAPIAAAGLNTVAGILSFVTSNSETLGAALRFAALGGVTLLAKSALPLIGTLSNLSKEFLVYNGLVTASGVPTANLGTTILGLTKSLALGAIQFGAIALAAQVAVNAIGLFGNKADIASEGVKNLKKSTEEYQQALRGVNRPQDALSDGKQRSFQDLFNDSKQDIGAAQELKDRVNLNRSNFFRGANSGIVDLFEKGDFFYEIKLKQKVSDSIRAAKEGGEEVSGAIVRAQSEIAKAGGDVNRINPVVFDAITDELLKKQSTLKKLTENAQSVQERNIYEDQLKSLEPLIKLFEKSVFPTLNLAKAFKELEAVNVRADANIAKVESDVADGRGKGLATEYQAQSQIIRATIEERQKQADAAEVAFKKLRDYLQTPEYRIRVEGGTINDSEQQRRLLEAEKDFYTKRKEIGESLTRARELGYNRRNELLQREVAAQERAQATFEGRRRVASTGRDATLAESIAARQTNPQQARFAQIDNTAADAGRIIDEQLDKRQAAIANLRKAQENLRLIDPVDGSALETARQEVAKYSNAILAADQEINTQRKVIAEAETQRREEAIAQELQRIDLIQRKTEMGVTQRIQDANRLAQQQRRAFDEQQGQLERLARTYGTIKSIVEEINRRSEVTAGGRVSGLKRAEDLAKELRESDPAQNRTGAGRGNGLTLSDIQPLTRQSQDRTDTERRDRLSTVLRSQGVGTDEERIFRQRIEAENQLAKVKAETINNEIRASEITLTNEQRREEIARRRALAEAEAAKRAAELNVTRSGTGVQVAQLRLEQAQQTGDPLKVLEAQLNLEQAQLEFRAAADELPSTTTAVNEALKNLADSIAQSDLQRELNRRQAETRRTQFGFEERDRLTTTEIDAATRGLDFGRNRPQDASGLVRRGSINLRDSAAFSGSRRTAAPGFTGNDTGVQTYAPDLRRLDPSFVESGNRAIAPAPRIDASRLMGADLGKTEDAIRSAASGTGLTPVTNLLGRLVEIEERLSLQILGLADKDRVQVNNQNFFGSTGKTSVLAGSGL